ncbi:MAG: 2-phospho-L-lactate transferase [bacterium]|nr:2-phospho-L-lactate transferase [bacterium]MCP5065653.1 2-phospho-L-lactate transferase [bacterium]
MRLVALAGGVGAARFLRGLVRVVDPAELTVVINTGDDREFYGVHVSPDLDIVIYTLAGRVDQEKGYGLEGDRFSVVDALADLGHETWFRLGDLDLATALHRSLRLREGAGLAEITNEITRAYGVGVRVLPMSEDPAPTFVELSDGSRAHFEEYLARDGAPDDVAGVDLTAAEAARPGPGVLEAIRDAEVILVCPSNPVVSIGPILAVAGVRAAIDEGDAPVVGISPIISGAPVKGPADRLLRGIGVEVSARGVAGHYADFLDGIVIDQRDAALRTDVEALGIACAVTETWMRSPEIAASLAKTSLDLAAAVRSTR